MVCDVALECRMVAIHEPIQLFAAPSHLEADRCAQRGDDAVDIAEGEAADLATLEPRDDLP